MKNEKNALNDSHLDIFSLMKILLNEKGLIFKLIISFTLIGLFFAIFTKTEFTSSTTVIPQTNSGKSIGGSIGGLAAIAGINLGGLNNDSGISPTLYPQIINSLPFQKELLKTPLIINGVDGQISYENFYKEKYNPGILSFISKYTIGLPRVIVKALKGSSKSKVINTTSILTITNEEKELIKILEEQILLDINDKEGYITISVRFPQAIGSAQLTEKVKNLLQSYIIEIKIQKSKEKFKFITKRYIEKGKEFEKIQLELAEFRDSNQHISSLVAKTKLDELQSKYDLAFTVYEELSKQMITQEIQIKEDTPIFSVLKPVSIPIVKSKPSRSFILLIWVFLGIVFSITFVLLKDFYLKFKKRIN